MKKKLSRPVDTVTYMEFPLRTLRWLILGKLDSIQCVRTALAIIEHYSLWLDRPKNTDS